MNSDLLQQHPGPRKSPFHISGLLLLSQIGKPEFFDMIATEEDGTTEEEILEFMKKKGHPALSMEAAV